MSEVDYAAFEAEVREFAETKCPPDIREIVRNAQKLTREPWARWQKVLYDHGWGAPNWPVAVGGTGWDTRQRYIFDTVLAETHCPPQYHHGLRHLGPVLLKYGTDEQRERFLPGILKGDDWWCQGYSEPGSGSDLASLRTKAELDDDDYVVNGQKIWTSHAHEADWIYTLVRTSTEDKKQKGITLLLIPISSPGITVKEIKTIDGIHHVNEVFFENVRVPVANRVGEEGQGWTYGKYLLSHERLGGANTAPIFQLFDAVKRLSEKQPNGALRRADTRLRLIEIESKMLGLKEQGRAAVGMAMRGENLGIVPSAIKVTSCNIQQAICDIAVETVGPTHAARRGTESPDDKDTEALRWISTYFLNRSRTIVGGSDEVQKNLVSAQLFGTEIDRLSPPLVAGAMFEEAERAARGGLKSWADIAALGWPMTLVPEESGGAGAELADLAAIVEGAARGGLTQSLPMACAVTPLLLAHAPAGAARDAALAAHMDGSARVVTALLTEEGGLDRRDFSLSTGAKPSISGLLGGVEGLADPTHLLLASADQLVLVDLAQGVTVTPNQTLDGRPTLDFTFDGATGTTLADGGKAARALSMAQPVGTLLTCVDAVGSMVPVIQQTIDYLLNRKQFDQPLAQFQVLRHKVAELFMTYLNASATTLRALNDMSAGDISPRSLAMAKLRVSRDARQVAHGAIQLHGGMGMTEELAVTRLNKRLLQSGFDFGDAMLYAERLAEANA
ncbi:acyl-CoA dehydrogenase family protein [Oceanicola sp. 22II-s10i]|uniref:acyl-CoA dehydrogenase family protein n=1 Tax=Oceanicola sp. 22II-s10i TaxID=1317116 RepID=UPI000B523E1D|nr:acyl-CoA dehydrogenase family protein [Oceanicola sp. 22II-s10i]